MTPVCHGSVAFIDTASPVCADCPHVRSCLALAKENIKELPDSVETRAALLRLQTLGPAPEIEGVALTVSRRGVARRALCEGEEQRLQALTSRARGLARRLLREGWFDLARSNLARGSMPGGIEGTRLHQCLQLLLRGIDTRRALVLAFTESGLSPAAAQVEASTVISVLEFGRLARFQAGRVNISIN